MGEGSWVERTFYPESDPISNMFRGSTQDQREAKMAQNAAAAEEAAAVSAAAQGEEESKKRAAAYIRDLPPTAGFPGGNKNTARSFLLTGLSGRS